ncbi:MAG: DUF4912 domain-containing protein [Candidatus Omnitrophica bacterium]|nr:DUF4912 domain-containing protein [Candidatus Omnitrophota bacterium]
MSKTQFVENYCLPGQYDQTSLTLIVRDPFWLFAYWNISQSSLDNMRTCMGNDQFEKARYTLRVYDVSLINFNGYNANNSFDIEVGRDAKDWYINLWADGASYCVDIGLKNDSGNFFLLSRSNCVTTQRAGLSGRDEAIWMNVENGDPNDAYVYAANKIKQENRRIIYKEIDPQKQLSPALLRKARLRQTLTEDDIREYYSKMFPLLCRIKLRRKKRKGKWGLDDSDLDALYAADPFGNQMDMDREARKRMFIDRSRAKIMIGSSADMLPEGASENRQDLMVNPLASQELIPKELRRKFFFEIGTELIVYGRTEPDAKVTLGGKPVELKPDGTFTLRFALPDGNIPLDFIARSFDGVDSKNITTRVERSKTVYGP